MFKWILYLIFHLYFIPCSGTKYIYTFCGNGFGGYAGDGVPAIDAQIFSPYAVSFSPNNEAYIADYSNNRIRLISNDGIITTFAGNGVRGYSGDGGLATDAELYNPTTVAVSIKGDVYIGDHVNNRIRVVYTNGTINAFAGNGAAGYSGDGGPALNASLFNPTGVAISLIGDVYIADTYNCRIRIVFSNGTITTFSGNGIQGYAGDGGSAIDAELYFPFGVSVSAVGIVYIADSFNQRIRKVFMNGTITTLAGNGRDGYSGDGGLAINAKFSNPSGVMVSNNGEVYITDKGNNRIRVVFVNGTVNTIAGNGIPSYSGDGEIATNAMINHPDGIGISSIGDIYIADTSNNRIRILVNKVSVECSYNGILLSQKYCICNKGYTGNICKFSICYGVNSSLSNVCNGHGTCSSPNNRECNLGYTGYICQPSICYEINGTSTNICSGHGTCKSPNKCICKEGYTGYNCQSNTCYGINETTSSVCSGHGTCQLPNQRACNKGYTGYNCQSNICYGVNQTSNNVCSGRGTCQAPNFCNCRFGYQGTSCQIQRNFQLLIILLLIAPLTAFIAGIYVWYLNKITKSEQYTNLLNYEISTRYDGNPE